jgi:hypothetical protein
MQQRVGLAQALINNPDLLILDEPTSGLDPLGRMKVREIIQRLKNEGKTVFFSSHELGEVETVCDRVAIINRANSRRRHASAISSPNTRPIWKRRFWTSSAIKHNPRHEYDLGIGRHRHQGAVPPQGFLRPVCPHGAHHHRRRHGQFLSRPENRALRQGHLHVAHLGFGAAHRHRHHGAADSRRARKPHHFPAAGQAGHARQFILGKFLGCWLATGIALLVFYVFFAIITARANKTGRG